jgi:hypothetical protein
MAMTDFTRVNNDVIFTISDPNYAYMALTMFDSAREFYPDTDFVLFVIGKGESRFLNDNVQLVYIHEIMDKTDLDQRFVHYLQVELATSVRPDCFKFLFDRGYGNTIYLDPDIYVFRRMTEVDDLLNSGSVNGIVTPHAMKSISKMSSEGDAVFLQCGIFNMGFFALKNSDESLRMLAWWKDKLKWHCIVDWPRGYFVDQKWLNFLPTHFDGFHVLKLPTYNLAPWNSENYNIISDGKGRFYIDHFDNPVAFIHFSGIRRSNEHYVYMSSAYKFYVEKIAQYQLIRTELTDYDIRHKVYNFPFDRVCSFIYKDYVQKFDDRLSNPLTDEHFYWYLINTDAETGIPIYIRKLLDILPDIFVGFTKTNQPLEYDNIIHFMRSSFNYDSVARLETLVHLRGARARRSISVNHSDNAKSETLLTDGYHSPHATAIQSVSCSTPQNMTNEAELFQFIEKGDRIELSGNSIRVCIPKLDRNGAVPHSFQVIAKDYTEIWVPSAHSHRKFCKAHKISNVAVIPPPVRKAQFKLQPISMDHNKFVAMLHHDLDRALETQNTVAILKAFQLSLRDKDAVLVCVLTGGDSGQAAEDLKAEISRTKNAIAVECELNSDLYYSYLHWAHCFISLDTDLDFGFTVTEAMAFSKIVVATNQGGPADYLNNANAYLVEVSETGETIRKTAKVLKELYSQADPLNDKSRRARLSIEKHFSSSMIGYLMEWRLHELSHMKKGSQVARAKQRKSQMNKRIISATRWIPLVRSYAKLLKARDHARQLQAQFEQREKVISILLKNVNRPAILE